MKNCRLVRQVFLGSVLHLVIVQASLAQAQSGSLFRRPGEAPSSVLRPVDSIPAPPPNTPQPSLRPDQNPDIYPPNGFGPDDANSLQYASYAYVPTKSIRQLNIHDIVTVRVDELAVTTAQGNAQSRKSSLLDARLNDWIDWVSLDTIKPAPQSDGDPRVQGNSNEAYRAQSTLQTREQMTFNITTEIVDIRPNGNLVLLGRKTIGNNDNTWELSFTGECRAQDIGPDNTVLSRNILNPGISKNERGHVRDGYSRGWFQTWYARFKPF